MPALRAVFAARYAEQRLFVYEQRGETEAGQGAIIACVDCFGSMSTPRAGGVTGEAWAKACALALLDQARAAHRDFAGILFSSAGQHQVFRFPASQPPAITDVLDFAETFYGGGTDFQTPLDTAAALLDAEHNTDGRMRGDIVLITDGNAASPKTGCGPGTTAWPGSATASSASPSPLLPARSWMCSRTTCAPSPTSPDPRPLARPATCSESSSPLEEARSDMTTSIHNGSQNARSCTHHRTTAPAHVGERKQ